MMLSSTGILRLSITTALLVLLPVVTSTDIKQLVTLEDWNALFPSRWFISKQWKSIYNPQKPWYYPKMEIDYFAYESFVEAFDFMQEKGVEGFADVNGASDEDKKRELCAFFGNVAHETGSEESGLFFREELHYERAGVNTSPGYRSVGSRTTYTMSNKKVYFESGSTNEGKVRFTQASYHGRGPIQLSWGYNYGDFSKVIYGDPQVLLEDPDRLLNQPVLGWASAIWFWMSQPDWRPTHFPHQVIYKRTSQQKPWGFGRTIMAINGGLEGNAKENGSTKAAIQVSRRIKFYRKCAKHFKIQIGQDGEQLDTHGMSN